MKRTAAISGHGTIFKIKLKARKGADFVDNGLLLKTAIFSGLNEEELAQALEYLAARGAEYKKGENLINPGDRMERFGIVMSGTVQVSSYDINGNQMIMTSVARGGIFGESLSVIGVEESPICAAAAEDCNILWLRAEPIRKNRADSPLHTKIVANFIGAIAHKCLAMNDRVQILSKKTIREKVITYLSQLAEHKRKSEFTLPLDRQNMANYLGVERSALSRELSKMAAEGIISYRKNNFKILKS